MIEIDGPRTAYFESKGHRFFYEQITFHGDNPIELMKKLGTRVNEIKHELSSIEDSILIWRIQPNIKFDELEGICSGKYVASCRFTTYPELTNPYDYSL